MFKVHLNTPAASMQHGRQMFIKYTVRVLHGMCKC